MIREDASVDGARTNAVALLDATFSAARDFGLSDEQIWRAVRSVADHVPADRPVAECLEHVSAALAEQIEFL